MIPLRITTTVNNFQLSFLHDHEARMTECWLRELTPTGTMVDIYRGHAYCHNKDNFCKATGRKIALTRALQHNFTRNERKQIWDQYFVKVRR